MALDSRIAALTLAVLTVLAAAGGYLYYIGGLPEIWQQGDQQEQATTTTVAASQGGAAAQEAHAGPQEGHGPRGGGMEAVEAACASIGDMKPGEAIRTLFSNSSKFEWTYREYPEEWRIEWEIVAEDESLAEILYYHILQMECILENGGTPRSWDPVFVLESKLKPYIETEVQLDGKTVRVVKTAENECAWEVIKLHAEVVKNFFENGWDEAHVVHPVPEDVAEKCSEYMETSSEATAATTASG